MKGIAGTRPRLLGEAPGACRRRPGVVSARPSAAGRPTRSQYRQGRVHSPD